MPFRPAVPTRGVNDGTPSTTVPATESRAQDAPADGNASKSLLVGFASGNSAHRVDAALVERTTGLMTREDFVRGREAAEAAIEREDEEKARRMEREARRRKKKAKRVGSALSFDETEEIDPSAAMDEEETLVMTSPGEKRRRFGGGMGKDPTVSTEFLPDRAREEAERRERAEIESEYLERSRREKGESVTITYSYYDGTRRDGGKIACVKGDTVEQFLQKVRASLLKDGEKTVQRDMKHCDASGMMFIKEDLIIPHDVSFYDLIVSRARGKSGPLFRFDKRDDVRLRGGADVEVENSHPGKVILRTWYDRNKGMFPANRWEVYDPAKSYGQEGYRIK